MLIVLIVLIVWVGLIGSIVWVVWIVPIVRGTTLQNRDSPIFNPTQMCHNLPAECA